MRMSSHFLPEHDPEPETDRLPLPVPEFSWRNTAIRLGAAFLCFLLMGWMVGWQRG
jgi:hypothetical protein